MADTATPPLLYPLAPVSTATLQLHQSLNLSTTGTTLWPSSLLLSHYLLSLPRRRHLSDPRKRLLDLGSGIGLLPLAAASLGYDVTASDLAPVVPCLEANIAANFPIIRASCLNPGSITTRVVDWFDYLDSDESRSPSEENWDVITTSDTLYHAPLLPGLLAAIENFAKGNPKVELYVAFENRDGDVERRFWGMLEDAGWRGKRVKKGEGVGRGPGEGWKWGESDGGSGDKREEGGKDREREEGDGDGEEEVDAAEMGLDVGFCEVWKWGKAKEKKRRRGKEDEGRKEERG